MLHHVEDSLPPSRLWGMRSYLIGAMDRVADRGMGWRRRFTPFLSNLGVVVLDPSNKPINIGTETEEACKYREELFQNKQYDEYSREVRLMRVVDLRMVDMSDFVIFNVDIDVHACGSYEESFWSNRLKNPVLIHCEQGKKNAPRWMFGAFPHQHIFSTWAELQAYLVHVHTATEIDTMKRWMFFDYSRMIPNVDKTQSIEFAKNWKAE